jgi:formylglycine-generating enzyme required for sulfatase activity
MIKIKAKFSLLAFCLVILLPLLLAANNIAISNPVLTAPVPADKFVMVQFNLSWENSWRTSSAPSNWDAAWVFVKYRVSGGDWQHATLHSSGHSGGTGTSATITPAADGTGAFIYRSGDGSGAFAITGAQLRWDYGVNGVADNATVDIRVFAIEMVYVPQGTFALGSGGAEFGAFYMYPTTTTTYSVSSEAEITVGTSAGNLYYPNPYDFSGDQTGPVPVAFPKGYNDFYCMKYEISQQQYVDFLNTLTQTQAAARKYTGSYNRYGITGSEVGSYATTNPYVACNFLSWADGAAYSDWAGLRPLTELEYEKACRGTLTPVANEYAWGTTTIASSAYTLSDAGASNEGIDSNYSSGKGNASYNTTAESINGPLRVGIFAANSLNTGRITAGASYYGIMELSGNLYERPVTIGNATGRGFTGLHGDGALDTSGVADVSNWPGTNAVGIGIRGGSWYYVALFLRVSDRVYAAGTTAARDYRHGFRAVRSGPVL